MEMTVSENISFPKSVIDVNRKSTGYINKIK